MEAKKIKISEMSTSAKRGLDSDGSNGNLKKKGTGCLSGKSVDRAHRSEILPDGDERLATLRTVGIRSQMLPERTI